ncbi:MAG: TolC family protein [Tannerella sp.]|jgi:outer membrane protein TolC|nr:TolC family protein [Tannerella sp.]
MRKISLIKVSFCFLCAFIPLREGMVLAQSPAHVLEITLPEALEIALSAGLTVKVADMEIQKQKYAEKGAYASLFPQIDLLGNYQYAVEKQKMYMDGVPGMDQGIRVGRDNLWSVGVPLISVQLWRSLKISAYDVELSVEKARSSRIEMRYQVQKAFYAVLLAEDAHAVFREAYDNALRNYHDIKNKYEQGLVAEYDLIRANVNVRNAEPNLYDATNAIELSLWHLKVLLGINLDLGIRCVGTLSDYDSSLEEEYLQIAFSLEKNSDLQQIDIQQEQLKKLRQTQIAEYFPSLSAQFSYQWISMNNNFRFGDYKWDPYSTVGLSLSIPVFSGGKRFSEVKKTEVMQKQLNLQRLDLERQLRLAHRQSTDQIRTCLKQYQAATAGVNEAEKGYQITMKRYETGEGTLLEINDSQLQLTQARLNLNQAIYNYLIARSELEKIQGETN